jgi:hypothetical protein
MVFSGFAFFLPPKEDFFSLKGVARQMAVRCKGLSADGNTCIHRCRQHLAALVLRTYTFRSFFFLFDYYRGPAEFFLIFHLLMRNDMAIGLIFGN